MTITVTTADAERIARMFGELISVKSVSAKGFNAIQRRAINKVGSSLRKQTRVIAPPLFGTTAAALQVQGRAARPGSDKPQYSLRMARKIPVGRLKASHRKITRRSGRASLSLTLPGADRIVFRAIHRDGASFRLLRAGPLRERALGGVYTNAARAFTKDGYPELYELRRGAEKDLVQAVSEGLRNHFAKAKKR